MTDKLTYERDGAIGRVWFNRPDKRNAFDGETVEALLAAFDEAGADDRVRVIVLGGRGPSFCAGADLRWMAQVGRSGDNLSGAGVLSGMFDAINDSRKPVIARVHGAVRGGGNGVVACCDIPVATPAASFALTEVRLGLAPAVISPYVIARIGVPAARELFVTGAKFGAERALQLGLVHYVEADEAALDARVERLAGDIVKGGPNAVAECKQLAMRVMEWPKGKRLEHTTAMLARLRASAEGQEGMMSFVQKRPPKWVTDAEEAAHEVLEGGGDEEAGG